MVNDYETMLCDILSGEATEDYIHRIKGIPLLTREEEKDLFDRIKNGDKIARDKIIIHNLRFAVNYALHYQNYGLSLGDLIQEGSIGIIYAVSRFDVTKGYRFGTYARDWIEQKIKLAIANTARSIRIPIHTFDKLIKYEQVKEKLTKKLNHLPSREEIANELEVSVDIIAQYEEMEKVPLSLNYLIDDNSTEFEKFISSNAPSAEDEVLKANLPNEIRKLSTEEINKKIAENKEELFNLRMKQATGSLENPGRIKELRHTVARLIRKTQYIRKELNILRNMQLMTKRTKLKLVIRFV